MTTLSHTFSNTAAPGAASATFFLRDGQSADWTAVGTIDAGCHVALQRQLGAAWVDVKRWPASTVNAAGRITAEGGSQTYRFRADVPTTDPVTTLASFACALADRSAVLEEVFNPNGTRVFALTDEGIEAPKISDGSAILTGGSLSLPLGSVQHSRGGSTGGIIRGFGRTAAEGLQEAIIEETVSFVDNVALYKELTYTFPASTVIVSAQANIESALTGGGTTAKVGLGDSGDPDKYGLTGALTKNAKIDTQPAAAAGFASPTAIRISSCAANGAAGDTALTVGSVRVRIVYRALVSLANA